MFGRFVRSLKDFSQRSSASVKRASIAFLLMRLGLSFWFWLIKTLGLLETTSGTPELHGVEIAGGRFVETWINIWLRWDSIHYLRIARYGYVGDERSGFYPLYPLLGRIAGLVFGGDAWLGLLFISNLFAFLAYFLLDLWMISIGREKQAAWALAGLALFPTGFFLLAGYPHSLLLFLTLAGVWCLTNQRWSLAFLAGLAAGLTHSTALPLTFLFIFWPTAKRRLFHLLTASGPLLGIAAFMAWRAGQGYPDYIQLLEYVWGRGWIAPWVAFVKAKQALGWTVLILRSWPNILIAVLSICAIAWAARHLALQHALYQAGLVILLLATGTEHEFLSGFGRYALSGYPLFAAIPAVLHKDRPRALLLAISLMMQLYLSGLFVLWAFVG